MTKGFAFIAIVLAIVLMLTFGPWPSAPDAGVLGVAGAPEARSDTVAANGVTPAADAFEREQSVASAPVGSIERALRVVAVDGDDRPIDGATVFAGSNSNNLLQVGLTRATGEFELSVASGDDPPRLVAAAGAGYQPSAPHPTVGTDGVIRLVLGAGAAGRVRGRVLDPAGNPLAGVAVYAGRNEPPSTTQRERGLTSRTPGLVTVTAADGTFALDGVFAGWFRFIAKHPRFAPLVVFGEVEAGSEQWIERRLRDGTVVTGRAFEPSGRPLAGATVEQGQPRGFESRSTRTATDGSYRTEPLIAGQKVQLRDADGRVLAETRISKSAGALFVWNPIAGEREARIHGRILRADGLDALLVRAGPRGRGLRDVARADSTGRFSIPRPRGRNVRISVFAARSSELPLEVKDIAIPDPPNEVQLQMPTGIGFGRVTASVPSGTGALTLMREVGGGASRISIAIESEDDGEVVQDAVPSGADYRLVANLDSEGGDYTLARFTMPLAEDGRVAFFHDCGYSVGTLMQLGREAAK